MRVIVSPRKALTGLSLARLNHVVAQPNHSGLGSVPVIQNHLRLINLEFAINDAVLHVVRRNAGYIKSHSLPACSHCVGSCWVLQGRRAS